MSDYKYMCRICGADGNAILHVAVVSPAVDEVPEDTNDIPGPWHWEILEHDGSRRAKSIDEFSTKQEAWDDINKLLSEVAEK